MTDKIKPVDFTGKNQLDAALSEAERNLSKFAQISALIARERKIRYDAHIKAGFSPAQALELCKA